MQYSHSVQKKTYSMVLWLLLLGLAVLRILIFQQAPSDLVFLTIAPLISAGIWLEISYMPMFRWFNKRQTVKLAALTLTQWVLVFLTSVPIIILLERQFFIYEHLIPWGSGNLIAYLQSIAGFIAAILLVHMAVMAALYYYWLSLQLRLNYQGILKNKKSTELHSLGTEIDRHFLFNTFNSVSVAIRKGNADMAIDMVSNISDILRTRLYSNNQIFTTLEKELELVNKYVQLELYRFGDKIEVAIKVEDGSKSCLVPTFILQPLFENAFKHGIKYNGQGRIAFESKCIGDRLVLSVFNSGSMYLPEQTSTPGGIGIQNIVSRLLGIYVSDYSFKIKNKEEGVVVEINLPKK